MPSHSVAVPTPSAPHSKRQKTTFEFPLEGFGTEPQPCMQCGVAGVVPTKFRLRTYGLRMTSAAEFDATIPVCSYCRSLHERDQARLFRMGGAAAALYAVSIGAILYGGRNGIVAAKIVGAICASTATIGILPAMALGAWRSKHLIAGERGCGKWRIMSRGYVREWFETHHPTLLPAKKKWGLIGGQ